MYGLAFFGFVVIAAICFLFVPRVSFAVTVLILAGNLGWINFGNGHDAGFAEVFAIVLTIIFGVVGMVIDLKRLPIWENI
jgi:hypothetical protein